MTEFRVTVIRDVAVGLTSGLWNFDIISILGNICSGAAIASEIN